MPRGDYQGAFQFNIKKQASVKVTIYRCYYKQLICDVKSRSAYDSGLNFNFHSDTGGLEFSASWD